MHMSNITLPIKKYGGTSPCYMNNALVQKCLATHQTTVNQSHTVKPCQKARMAIQQPRPFAVTMNVSINYRREYSITKMWGKDGLKIAQVVRPIAKYALFCSYFVFGINYMDLGNFGPVQGICD